MCYVHVSCINVCVSAHCLSFLRGSGGLAVDEKKAYELTMQAAEAGM
jgi:hypothetical protein